MKKISTSDFVINKSSVPQRSEKDTEYNFYVGLDVHKASIAVAVAPSLIPRLTGIDEGSHTGLEWYEDSGTGGPATAERLHPAGISRCGTSRHETGG